MLWPQCIFSTFWEELVSKSSNKWQNMLWLNLFTYIMYICPMRHKSDFEGSFKTKRKIRGHLFTKNVCVRQHTKKKHWDMNAVLQAANQNASPENTYVFLRITAYRLCTLFIHACALKEQRPATNLYTLQFALIDAIQVSQSSRLSFVSRIIKHTRLVTVTWYSASILAHNNSKNMQWKEMTEWFSQNFLSLYRSLSYSVLFSFFKTKNWGEKQPAIWIFYTKKCIKCF